MFNVPPVVTATLAALVLIQAVRDFILTPEQDIQLLLLFAFIPARFEPSLLAPGAFPGGWGAQLWTFVTYALIHGSWLHLGLNAVWFLAFGSPVARRFGVLRFAAFLAATAAAGAAAHLMTQGGELVPMVGASASISGCMAAATRFVFQRNGPLGLLGGHGEDAARVPAAPLLAALREPRILIFVGVWFALNALSGIGALAISPGEQAVAWQAHVGGFVAGLLGFAAFDPVNTLARAGGDDSGPAAPATSG
jgi:membrane associated rhomboid family serine protease